MVVENFVNFSDWIGSGLPLFGFILLTAVVLGVFCGYLVASLRHGPFEAFYVVAQVIAQAIPDFLFTSPRRILAIAGLAIKEALRRKVILVTFGIFATSLLFGGWFMDSGSEHPDRIYVNFVLWGTQLLILLMGLLISAFSLPEDIKNKTIYTIVTKPVRPTEIVIGRIVGFGLLGTGLLALMGVISFLFVWRGLAHEHQVVGDTQTLAEFVDVPEDRRSAFSGRRVSENAIKEAETNTVAGHKHRLELIEDIREAGDEPRIKSNIVSSETLDDGRTVYQRVFCLPVGGHTHRVTISGEGASATIALGPASGYFRARQPIYAESLQFYDRLGKPSERGYNIGKEWTYRGYVDGGSAFNRSSLSKAEFQFENLSPSRFINTDLIPLEMNLGVFRTYKADIEKRVTGGIQIESVPESEGLDNRFVADVIPFETNEYSIQTLPIPRKLVGRLLTPDGKLLKQGEFDLFEDFASNGRLKLSLTCRDVNQYLGVARADLYFRTADQVYWWNFFKGYLGIWCQMMIIISMGVAFSTFLSAPIVMLGTLVMMILGFFTTFIREMTEADHEGGGPIESFYRVVTQQNMVLDLDTGVATTLIQNVDKLLVQMLSALTYLAPNFSQMNFSDFLTYGFAIDSSRVLVALSITLAFCFGLTILGYFALKTREIAK